MGLDLLWKIPSCKCQKTHFLSISAACRVWVTFARTWAGGYKVQPGDQGHPTGLDEKTYKPFTKLHELSESQQQEMGQFTQHPQGWLLEICN